MDQVEKAFNGRYREVNRETQQWYTYNHPVPEPRPGMVSTCALPSAGKKKEKKRKRFLSQSGSCLKLFEICHHSFLKDFFKINLLSVLLLLCGFLVTAESEKKWINHCHVVQYLSFCDSDESVYLPSVSQMKPGNKVYPPPSTCLTKC